MATPQQTPEAQLVFDILTNPLPYRKGSKLKREPWDAGLPQWLQNTLDEWQPKRGSDLAALTKCGRCGAYILDGWDGPGKYRVDPSRLTSQQELACRILGRPTFIIDARPRHGIRLTIRDQFNTPGHPADTHPKPVAPQHLCLRPLGEPIPWEQLYPQPKTERLSNEAPF